METRIIQFALDHALEIVLVFGDDGKITYANQAAKEQLEFGEDIYNRYIEDIFPNEFQTMTGSFLMKRDFVKEEKEIMAYRRNQTCFPVRSTFTKVQQNPVLYLFQGYNKAESQRLEKKVEQAGQEAEAAQKVKTEFVANVTHELRTPVNGILGNTLELLEEEADDKRLQKLRMIERGCKDMHALINNILDFSKLEAGKFVLEPREFNFRDMIEYVKGNHSNRIVEKGLDFAISVSAEIPENIIGDELRIVQVLNNLISNAYKFTSVGGIHVEVIKSMQSGSSMKLFFMVIDTGIGIAKQDQDKLFQSFTQVDASITRKYGGTGLGLSICRQLVELMGGNVYLESEYGKGSIFSFDIWVELPESCPKSDVQENDSTALYGDGENSLLDKLYSLTEEQNSEKVWQYGEPENTEEVKKKLTKLVLCIEMENWEKAEMFAETVKRLLEGAPREIGRVALRMKMAVQKSDYEKAVESCETLNNMLFDSSTEEPYGRNE